MIKSHVNKKERGSRIFAFGILEISIDLFGCQCAGGDERIRTADPLLAKQVLSQLSYIPWGTRCVLLATPVSVRCARRTDVSLRVRNSISREVLQTLKV